MEGAQSLESNDLDEFLFLPFLPTVNPVQRMVSL